MGGSGCSARIGTWFPPPRPHRPGRCFQSKQVENNPWCYPHIEHAVTRRSRERPASSGKHGAPEGLRRQRHSDRDSRRILSLRSGWTSFPETHGSRRFRTQAGPGFVVGLVRRLRPSGRVTFQTMGHAELPQRAKPAECPTGFPSHRKPWTKAASSTKRRPSRRVM